MRKINPLSRIGVSLNKRKLRQAKRLYNKGKVVNAQRIIFKELEKDFKDERKV